MTAVGESPSAHVGAARAGRHRRPSAARVGQGRPAAPCSACSRRQWLSGELLDGRRLEVFTLPMTTRFRGVTSREGVLVFGDAGVGEFSPFWDYDATESAIWLGDALEAADIGPPAALRDRVQVNCTVPAIDPEAALRRSCAGRAAAALRRSRSPSVARPSMTTWRESRPCGQALGPEGRVRVDANGGWFGRGSDCRAPRVGASLSSSTPSSRSPTSRGCATSGARTSVPIAADESIRRARDPLRVAQMAAADVVVLKVQPLGGVRACLALAARHRPPGRRVECARVLGRHRRGRGVGGCASQTCRSRAGWRRRPCSAATWCATRPLSSTVRSPSTSPRSTTTRSTATVPILRRTADGLTGSPRVSASSASRCEDPADE